MAKSKLVGEFDLDGSPLSAFNVSKAMAKAREGLLLFSSRAKQKMTMVTFVRSAGMRWHHRSI